LPSRLGVYARVTHLARHADKAVNTSEANADCPQPSCFHDSLRYRRISGLKGKHRARSSSAGPVQIVLWVRFEAGIPDAEATRLKKLSNSLGVGLLLLHANGKGLDAPHEEERVVGGEPAASGIDGEE